FSKFSLTLGCLAAHGFGEVAERSWVGEVKFFARVVGNDPRKHWILRQVVICSSSHCVDQHEVVEVGHFTLLPFAGSCEVVRLLAEHICKLRTKCLWLVIDTAQCLVTPSSLGVSVQSCW